jgi:CheY-like chemotaxis protein
MPGKMNGFDVLKAISTDQRFKGIPRIVLSNLSNTADIERAMALGATKFMVKANYTPEKIIAELKTEVGHY